MKSDRVQSTPLAIYKDTKPSALRNQQPAPGLHLGSRAERNKENCVIPANRTSTKIPQKVGARATIAAACPCIEVFVDEECAEPHALRIHHRVKVVLAEHVKEEKRKNKLECITKD